jgi:2-iminobutanoate/2-iminopropanoate deaminase
MSAIEYYNEGNHFPHPFSLAVRAGDFVYLSGQLGTDATGLVPGGFDAQARQAMDNIQSVLHGMGLSMDDTVKFTIMIADMNKWSGFNAIYKTYFKPGRLPARSALGANGLALNAELEIECMAYAPVKA